MRNLGNNALRNNKQFDTLDEAVLFAKGSNCWIDEVEVRSDGYFKSTEKVRKVIITNTPEEIFTQSTIVYFDRHEFDLEGYGYRINGEFVEIHQSELPRLKEKLGDDVFNSAMQVGKDYGVDTIIFTEDDFEENANPWTLAYEQFCQESDNKNKEGNLMDVSKLKIGDRVEFAEDTFAQVTNYETDISKQQGTVVNFSINTGDPKINTHVWIELDEPNEHFNCDEWGNAVEFNLFEDGIHDGGTSVNYLKRAKLLLTDKPSITINKIVVVEEYGSAYTIHEGAFLFTPIGEYNQIYYTTNPYEGGNVYDEWSEVDRSNADEHIDYDAILKALDYKESE